MGFYFNVKKKKNPKETCDSTLNAPACKAEKGQPAEKLSNYSKKGQN